MADSLPARPGPSSEDRPDAVEPFRFDPEVGAYVLGEGHDEVEWQRQQVEAALAAALEDRRQEDRRQMEPRIVRSTPIVVPQRVGSVEDRFLRPIREREA